MDGGCGVRKKMNADDGCVSMNSIVSPLVIYVEYLCLHTSGLQKVASLFVSINPISLSINVDRHRLSARIKHIHTHTYAIKAQRQKCPTTTSPSTSHLAPLPMSRSSTPRLGSPSWKPHTSCGRPWREWSICPRSPRGRS